MENEKNDANIDECLVIRCQLGDAVAWEELVKRWNPRLNGFLARMMTDPIVVEDLSQVVWLKAVRSLPQLKEPQRLAAWLYRIARTAVTDHLRKEYRSPTITCSESHPSSDDAALGRFIETDELLNGMQKLHPTDREAIVLHYFQHLSIAEVAEVCRVPAGTIKSRMNRARILLRKHLERGEV